MNKRCIGCGSVLQSKDNLKEGYIKENVIEKASYCERCFKIMHYGDSLVLDKKIDMNSIISSINKDKIPVMFLVDSTCISNNIFNILKKIKSNVYVILTKKDSLPKSIKDNKLKEYIYNNVDSLDINKMFVVSAKKNYNISLIYDSLIKDKVSKIYVIGITNSGKSSLINAFLKLKEKNPIITTSLIPNTTTDLIKIKLDDKLMLIDTPGFVIDNLVTNYIEVNKYKKIVSKRTIKPKIYYIRNGYSLIIEELLRIDSITDNDFKLVFYLNNDLIYKKVKSINSNDLNKYNKIELEVIDQDIVIEGLGFIKVVGSAKINLYVINKKVVSIRTKLI